MKERIIDIEKTNKRVTEILLDDYGFELSMKERLCVNKNHEPIPWYTYPAIEYLDQLDFSDKSVFEFGCGSSSLYWSRKAREVTSLEARQVWYDRIKADAPDNLHLICRGVADNYVETIYESGQKYDIIVIDGMLRYPSTIAALECLQPDGLIIFDNSDRAAEFRKYASAMQLLRDNNLLQVDMHGFTPFNPYTATTSLFFTRGFQVKPLNSAHPQRPVGGLYSSNAHMKDN